jgi:glycosyltransferase involved in cell wall biosynthesis
MNRLNVFRSLSTIIRKEAFDYIYFRYPHYLDYPFYRFSRKFSKKIILESQTKEKEELLLSRKYLKALFEQLFKKRIFANLYACISVTDEITNYQKKYDRNNSVFFKTIGNGIDSSKIPVAKIAEYPEEELKLLYVGNVFPHHGLDRMIRGISSYNGEYKVSFIIIGNGSNLACLQNLVSQHNLENQVQFVEPKYGSELNNYFDWAHLGIGALGIHRKGLTEASVLKLRDYAARGLPFVMSGKDPDFDYQPELQDNFLRVPLDNSTIDIEQLAGHIRELYSTRVNTFSKDLRSFAEEKLDMRLKMNELTEFMEQER